MTAADDGLRDAPGGDGADEIREQPKPREVLCGCGTVHHAVTPRERLIVVLHALANEDFDWRDAEWFADALLPTVQALIAKGAAAELLAAADDFKMPRNGRNVCRARADALDGTP